MTGSRAQNGRLVSGVAGVLTAMKVFVIRGRVEPDDISSLCDRARSALEGPGREPVVCDVGFLVEADAVTVDALARLQLIAKRRGCRMGLRNVGAELAALLALMGLTDVVPMCEELGVDPRWQPEQREEVLGVEEEADAGDLSAGDLEDL